MKIEKMDVVHAWVIVAGVVDYEKTDDLSIWASEHYVPKSQLDQHGGFYHDEVFHPSSNIFDNKNEAQFFARKMAKECGIPFSKTRPTSYPQVSALF